MNAETNEFIDIIDTIEREIGTYYQMGAIKFIDEHYDLAWSKAMDRFDTVLIEAAKTCDLTKAKMEAKIYKISIQAFLEQYKKDKHQQRVMAFLEDAP